MGQLMLVYSLFLATIKICDILGFAVKNTPQVGLTVFLKLLTVLPGRVEVVGNRVRTRMLQSETLRGLVLGSH